MTESNKRLTAVQTKLNRLPSQKAALEHGQKTYNKQKRMQRTRTLIQVGGLVSLTGLLDRFDIHLGEDLQIDLNQMDKAATLLGVFICVMEQIPHDLWESDVKALKDKGIALMKMHGARSSL
jgi:Conjugal transfer protein TraD